MLKLLFNSLLMREPVDFTSSSKKNYSQTRDAEMNQFHQFIQSLSHVQLFETPWTAVRQVSLSITYSQSLLRLMSIESVMLSNHLILCRPLLLPPWIFPSIRSCHMSQFFESEGQSIGLSASASVLPMNIQDWFPLGWTSWISLQSKELATVTVQKYNFLMLSFLYSPTLTPYMTTAKTISLIRRTFVGKVMSLPLICCLG